MSDVPPLTHMRRDLRMIQRSVRPASRRLVVSRAAACALLAGLALGISGCERADSKYEQAISEARDMMTVITAGSENRQADLQAVVSKLNAAMGEVEGDAKAPAQLMLARANSALAELDLKRASDLAAQISLDLTRADAIAREYNSNKAFAMTLVGPDASEAISNIESQIRAIDAEIASLQGNRTDLADELSGVQNEIDQLMSSARAERLEEADLRDESLDAEPMRRAELIAEAVVNAREAEAYERAAAEKELTGNSLEVAIAQVESIIEDQRALRAIQTSGLERISRVDAEITQQRAERQTVTRQTLEDYRGRLNAVIEAYRADFIGAVESASSDLGGAASLARQARGMGDLARSAAGEHFAAQARALELRAQTAARIAASADYLVQTGAENASEFASIAGDFRAEAERVYAAAANAYSEASGSFAGTGDVAAILSERYEARAMELRGEEPAQRETPAGDEMDG